MHFSGHAITELQFKDGVNTLSERYQEYYNIDRSRYSKVAVVDSSLGYNLCEQACKRYNKMFSGLEFLSDVDRLFEAFEQYRNTLFILNGLSLDSSIYPVIQMLYDSGNANSILLIESFEFMLLNSIFFHEGGYCIRHPPILEMDKAEFYRRQYTDFIADGLLGPITESNTPRCFTIDCRCNSVGNVTDSTGCPKSKTFRGRKGTPCGFELAGNKYKYLIRQDIDYVLSCLKTELYNDSQDKSGSEGTDLFTNVF